MNNASYQKWYYQKNHDKLLNNHTEWRKKQYTPTPPGLEIVFTPCNQCGIVFTKPPSSSFNRRVNRKQCTQACSKLYMAAHNQGWYGFGKNTIVKDKIDDIAPVIFPEEITYFNTMYADELSQFTDKN